jgi:two-component system sensor histidine kinase RegB
VPLVWAQTPMFSPQYMHALWVALMVTIVAVGFGVWRHAKARRELDAALQTTQAILAARQQSSALGALAAAAVHELGSPLSTIAVVASEMAREIHPDDPLAPDVDLLRSQSARCRAILADIARDPAAAASIPVSLRLDRLLQEMAAAHEGHEIRVPSRVPDNLPVVTRTQALEYGLGNLLGNAVSFSARTVSVSVEADATDVRVRIADDGPGFSPDVLRQIGQPYVSGRADRSGHMGLGLFIACNLLEASGAGVTFSNDPATGGAVVQIIWPRFRLDHNFLAV